MDGWYSRFISRPASPCRAHIDVVNVILNGHQIHTRTNSNDKKQEQELAEVEGDADSKLQGAASDNKDRIEETV